jgi:hypothetical protein
VHANFLSSIPYITFDARLRWHHGPSISLLDESRTLVPACYHRVVCWAWTFEMTSSMCGFVDVVMSHFRSITSQQLRCWIQPSSSCRRDLKAPANTHLNCPTAPSPDVCGGSMPYFFPFVFPRPLSLDTACMMNPSSFCICMHAPSSLAGRSDDSFPTVA